ncbi:5'-nucleotidase C-terminal domain-containing protein [Sedimentibacter sp. MB35-C1]|uniref:5'-nucleotidase C-terminal domain-containing protein n=1 Tax=Sedimentibacter sp. MB35-C1 TaxID=3070995 RepID=UPI0027DF23B4|nr:5'-nucleotidase C-terminal domain-containing protein [Sedimentibacter sp. MB35-C1]WMJ79057.1 5'-nucleotidase C-terminal domain-containing protein [Sedimentibacter sp. MB35-C1]
MLSSFSFAFADETGITAITIIHTNDIHGRIEEDSYNNVMGLAKIAALIKEAKEANPNTLVLDAGDVLHGMPIVNISKGENALNVLEAAGYDYMTIGNHDFNYGKERLFELRDMSGIGMLCANVLDEEGKPVFTPYTIEEMDGVKIGIFGLATPETMYKTSPLNVEGLTFADPVEISKEMVEELKDQTDVIIALAHIGLDESSVITSKAIAQEVDGIDVIIDGHSHTLLEEGMIVNNTLIAQSGNYDKNLGYVDISVQDGEVIEKTARLVSAEAAANTEADPELAAIIEEINSKNKETFDQVVAKTDVYLDGIREHVRAQETNLGNLSADAVRAESGADVAFVNGGGIRVDIQPGDITLGRIAELFPFGNIVQIKKITGEDLLAMLEHSVSGYPSPQGAFLHVSGLTFEFDPEQPAGLRVIDVKIGDSPLDLTAEYTVAINDFISVGGDGYEMLSKYDVEAEFGTYEEIFANYLNTNGTAGSEVSGRITVKETVAEEPAPVEPVEPEEPESVPEPEPAPVETVPEPAAEVTYIVVSGDVLWKIAEKYDTTWEILTEYNNLANPHLIFPDQAIKIPVK